MLSNADTNVLQNISLFGMEFNLGYNNRDGLTQVSPVLTGDHNFVHVVLGQSNACNYHQGSYTPAGSGNQNLNILDGGVYLTGTTAMLGCDGNTLVENPDLNFYPSCCFASRLADKFISAGKFTRVISVPIAMGGANMAMWASGGIYSERISVTGSRLRAAGLTAGAVTIHIGETDASAGTSQASCTASLNSIISQLRAQGMSCPVFVCLVSYSASGLPAGSTAVRAAQAAVVDNITVFQGADTDTLTGGTNRRDGTHMSPTGSDSMASLHKTAMNSHV